MPEHCKDCCCARSWKALGITEYNGKSIPEHISELKAENADLKEKIKQVHDIVSGSFSDSKTVNMIYEITKA